MLTTGRNGFPYVKNSYFLNINSDKIIVVYFLFIVSSIQPQVTHVQNKSVEQAPSSNIQAYNRHPFNMDGSAKSKQDEVNTSL